ncbi:hypothetical protein KY385_03385, partial [Candidatus Parcubacteria bacterium]|nr:hypothetical protein [Candidatus Parcubacteria bacterium]
MENQNLNSQLPPANSSAARKAKIMYSGLAFLFILSLSSSAFGLYAWNREKKNVTRLNSQVSS